MRERSTDFEREILEQPEVLGRLLETEAASIQELASRVRRKEPRCIVFAARGSSDNVARYGQYLLGAVLGLPVALATPSLVTVYGKQLRLREALVVAISQSGQSPDIVTLVRQAALQGGLTVAITNDPLSPLAASASCCIDLRAGVEKSVAATKTYTASLMALAMLGSALGGDEFPFGAIRELPQQVSQVLSSASEVARRGRRYHRLRACAVISRGYNYATAFEIALKLKELALVLAEPYSSADFWHGPVALVGRGFPVLAVVAEGATAPEMVELLRHLRQRGGELVVISPLDDALGLAHTPIPLPTGIQEWLSPVISVVPGQLFALGVSVAKKLDPDHPPGLQKVTRTR